MSIAPSLLMCVGRKFYKLYELVQEAENYGISKRIPITAIPEGMVRGLSKLLVAHPDAIVKVTAPGCTLQDLAWSLVDLGLLTQMQFAKLVDLDVPFWTGNELKPYDFVPESMLDVAMALSMTNDEDHERLVKEFELEFCMGVVGYSFVTGIQYVTKPGEVGLPPELAHLEGYVDPVHIEYVDEEQGQPDKNRISS
jgi:hypothetical protein